MTGPKQSDAYGYLTTLKFTFAAEGGKAACDATAKGSGTFSASVEKENNADYAVEAHGSFNGSYTWHLDRDECLWNFKEADAGAGGGVTFTIKDALVKVCKAIPAPPFQAFGRAYLVAEKIFAICGVKLENNVAFGLDINFSGLSWDKNPPLDSWTLPMNVGEADVVLSTKITVSGTLDTKGLTLAPDQSFNNPAYFYTPAGANNPTYSASGAVGANLTIQVYKTLKPKSFQGGGTVQVGSPKYHWTKTVNAPPYNFDLSSLQSTGQTDPGLAPKGVTPKDYSPSDMASALEAAGWVFSTDPTADDGTGNVYGTNSVLKNLANDLYQDGAPSLALDSAGVPFQAGTRSSPRQQGLAAGSMSPTTTAPAGTIRCIIPNSFGFDSYVNATTDRLGHRLVVFVYSDTSSLTWDLTGDQFMAALTGSDVYYSTFDGSSRSAPQPVATTPGADSDLQLSRLANGNVLAVWIYHYFSGTGHLLSSTWDGSAWTTPYRSRFRRHLPALRPAG